LNQAHTDLSDIVRRRAAPGILVVDLGGRVVFANEPALATLAALGFPDPDAWTPPSEVVQLCRRALEGQATALTLQAEGIGREDSLSCALRAFPLAPPGGGARPTHVMILLEGVVAKHQVDLEKARRAFDLSRRELEVLNLINLGCSNKKIADQLYLSEYTIKDHIKNLMKKLGASSRSEAVALLR
jgi:DNA-binding NarL/FixJ family response regulator